MSQGKTRNKLFSFVVNDDEQESLEELADHLERTKSDAVRMAVRHALDGIRRSTSNGEEVRANEK